MSGSQIKPGSQEELWLTFFGLRSELELITGSGADMSCSYTRDLKNLAPSHGYTVGGPDVSTEDLGKKVKKERF